MAQAGYQSKKKAAAWITLGMGLVVVVAAGFVLVFQQQPVEAGSGDNVSGWAWSGNIGWISFNCTDNGTCPPPPSNVDYGVNVNLATGTFSGEAWSDHIGWITFDPAPDFLTGVYPDANNPPYAACLDFPAAGQACDGVGDYTVSGWVRACSALIDDGVGDDGIADNCIGPVDPAAGGWDGWIKLRSTSGPAYGVDWDNGTGEFKGWAWGGDVVGWVSFNCLNDHDPVTPGVQSVCGTTPYQVVLTGANLAPTAAIDCSAWSCLTWKGTTFNPTPTFLNTSSDPDGVGDIVLSEWDVVGAGLLPDLSCGSNCNYTLPLSFGPGSYTMELHVEDSVGNADDATPQAFTIKQDAIADFECSPSGLPGTWNNCVGFVPLAGMTVYFRGDDGADGLSFASEDSSSPLQAAGITSWSWDFDPDGSPGTDCCANPFPSTQFPTTGPKSVTLTVTDDATRTATRTKTLQVIPPFPDWEEISPL